MKIETKTIILKSNGRRITFHNITDQVKDFVKETGLQNGQVTVVSPHTTCSVIFEEYTHDKDFNGDEYLLVDMSRILDNIVPRELTEGVNYKYPGQKHCDFLYDLAKIDPSFPADPGTILNGDAHIRASLFGSSETFLVKDGKLMFGATGYIYFIDFDQNRVRDRKCHIQVMGE